MDFNTLMENIFVFQSQALCTKFYKLLNEFPFELFCYSINSHFQTRVANLLGVAGTDVPISDIKKLTEQFKVFFTHAVMNLVINFF